MDNEPTKTPDAVLMVEKKAVEARMEAAEARLAVTEAKLASVEVEQQIVDLTLGQYREICDSDD